MRFEKGHKERTHGHILDVASRRFRQDGFSASGLAAVMSDAGLTNGAFYGQFASKEALLQEVLASSLSWQRAQLERVGQDGAVIEDVIRRYLDRSHVGRLGEGCPSAALLPEVGRQSETTRQAYADGLTSYVCVLSQYLPDPGSEASKRRAMALFSLLVGTLQIARAMPDATLAEDILESGVEAALALIGQSEETSSAGGGRGPQAASSGRRGRRGGTVKGTR